MLTITGNNDKAAMLQVRGDQHQDIPLDFVHDQQFAVLTLTDGTVLHVDIDDDGQVTFEPLAMNPTTAFRYQPSRYTGQGDNAVATLPYIELTMACGRTFGPVRCEILPPNETFAPAYVGTPGEEVEAVYQTA